MKIVTNYFVDWKSLMRYLGAAAGGRKGNIGYPPNVPRDCTAVVDEIGRYNIIPKDQTQ